MNRMSKVFAFTMAEVLITIGIIGIIAAMTLPLLITKYKYNVAETRLKKFYSTMNQAVLRAESEYGDKKTWYQDLGGLQTDVNGNEIEGSSKVDVWFSKYLAPYLQIINKEIASNGLPTYYFADGSALSPSQAGESRDWVFYIGSPKKCREKYNNDMGVCAFTFEFYPASTSSCWKYLYNRGFEPVKVCWDGTENDLYNNKTWGCAQKTNSDLDARGYCAALIQYNNWKIPKDYPVRIRY